MIGSILKSILIVMVSYAILRIIQYSLGKICNITRFDERYENTLCSVLTSISYYIIFMVSSILILKEFQIVDVTKFGTLVTGASIVGILAGVASQSILKDIFNGFFVLFEKQMQVGDFVIINEVFRGTIEEIGIRSTSLRDWDLKRITISNGSINSIRNFSKDKMRVVVHVRVSYEEDPMKVLDALDEVCSTMNNQYPNYLFKLPSGEFKSPFKIYGVTDIEDTPVGAKYTITGVVNSYKYFQAIRETKLQILLIFRKNKVQIAYPTHINIVHHDNEYKREL